MSGYGQAVTSKQSTRRIPRITSANQVKRAIHYTENRPMKLTIKQRIRNWLMDDSADYGNSIAIAEDCERTDLHSQGFRLQVYGASGGTIIETTKYDRKSDENRHSLHVVTDDKDLGEQLSKIITMEQLR
jgi:hypothetical protein